MPRYSVAAVDLPFFKGCGTAVGEGQGGGQWGCMRASQDARACALNVRTSGMHDLRPCKHMAQLAMS